MPKNKAKHTWILLSAFGIFFAIFSAGYEIIVLGIWWKGVAALFCGFVLYRMIVDRI